jgi:hypothetical protein
LRYFRAFYGGPGPPLQILLPLPTLTVVTGELIAPGLPGWRDARLGGQHLPAAAGRFLQHGTHDGNPRAARGRPMLMMFYSVDCL